MTSQFQAWAVHQWHTPPDPLRKELLKKYNYYFLQFQSSRYSFWWLRMLAEMLGLFFLYKRSSSKDSWKDRYEAENVIKIGHPEDIFQTIDVYILCVKIIKNKMNSKLDLVVNSLHVIMPTVYWRNFKSTVSREFRHFFYQKLHLGPIWTGKNGFAMIFAKIVCWLHGHRVGVVGLVIDHADTVLA